MFASQGHTKDLVHMTGLLRGNMLSVLSNGMAGRNLPGWILSCYSTLKLLLSEAGGESRGDNVCGRGTLPSQICSFLAPGNQSGVRLCLVAFDLLPPCLQLGRGREHKR